MSLKTELEELAASLEAAVPLATTRIEHIRVAGHATRARRLAQLCPADDESPNLPYPVDHQVAG